MGMFVMIFSKKVASWFGYKGKSDAELDKDREALLNTKSAINELDDTDIGEANKKKAGASTGRFIAGMISATMSGTFGAFQWVTICVFNTT